MNLARLSASAANLQPLKYLLACEPKKNAAIFSCLAWAGYLKDWPGPAEGERPAAYIVILGTRRSPKTSAATTASRPNPSSWGPGRRVWAAACWAPSSGTGCGNCYKIPASLDILLVIALGRPRETVVLEEVGPDGSIKYWRDAQGVHHVPKRRLEDIILS